MLNFLKNLSKWVFLPAIGLLIIGMLYSTWLTSFSQFVLAGAWVFRFDWKNQVQQFLKHPIAIWITLLFLLYLASILYSADYSQGFNEVRIVLPIFLLPFLFSGLYDVTANQFKFLVWFYVAVVLSAVFSCIPGIYDYYNGTSVELRESSKYISHIRLSLHVCLSICLLAKQLQASFFKYWLLLFPIGAFVLWLVLMQALTGILILSLLFIFSLLYLLLVSSRFWVKLSLALGFPGLIFLLVLVIQSEYDAYFQVHETQADYALKTRDGNKYTFNNQLKWIENGAYIFDYLCESEIETAWGQRSALSINGLDKKGQPLKQTLIRYLNSKGLRKDSEAVNSLTDYEISCIERGIANHYYINPLSLKGRLYQLFWELEMRRQSQTVSNHGIIGKAHLWKTAIEVWSKNWFFGIGVGDLKNEFVKKINENYPNSEPNLRVHNQYLTIGLSTGLIGLFLYLLSIFKIIVRNKNVSYWPVLCFYFIALISMLTEDTLNTQAGVTFYAFLICFFSFFPSVPETTTTNSPFAFFDSK